MLSFLDNLCIIHNTTMQKIIDNLGITISSLCAIHCVFLPAIFIVAPYSFLASHEFHEALIYFILPCALVAFVLGCKKHGDIRVVVTGTIGILILGSALLLHDIHHADEEHEGLLSIIVTVIGSLVLIMSHLRNRKLCAEHEFECHK
jgi:uncharacterized membrane protein YeaQ/YmgE (transglycosylase-associated protein family)